VDERSKILRSICLSSVRALVCAALGDLLRLEVRKCRSDLLWYLPLRS
jgi:hypothetical protein